MNSREETLTDLNLLEVVNLDGTHWEPVTEQDRPTWSNTKTNHILQVELNTESSFDYCIRLHHAKQDDAWWTITELNFAGELIPLVEWVTSMPDDWLPVKEMVTHAVEPFWSRQDSDSQSTSSY